MPIRYVDDEPISTALPQASGRVRYVDEEPQHPQVSQWQGFKEGLQTVADNLEPIASVLPFSAGGTMQRRQLNDLNQQGIDEAHAQGIEGGEAGKFFGKLAGSAPLAVLPGVGPALGGGLMGYAGSEGDTLGDKAIEAGLGAVGGKVGGAVVNKLTDAIAPVISPAVRRLADQGVKLTPGQMRGPAAIAAEDKMASRPFVGDAIREGREKFLQSVNIAAVDEALAPLGIKLPAGMPAGHEAVAFAQDVVSAAYEKVVPQLAVRADPRLAVSLRDVYTSTVSKLPKAQQAQFQSILNGVNFGQGGQLSGRQLQTAVSDLGRLARTYSTSATAAERELGRAVSGVKSAMDDLMVRQNPAAAPVLKATNDAWKRLTVVENAASRADDGVASTAQIRQAARAGDQSRRKRATAAGRAGPMQQFAKDVREVGAATIGNSGTADRLMQLNPISNALGGAGLIGYRAGAAWGNALRQQSPELIANVRNALTGLRVPFTLGGASLATQGRK